MKSKDGNNRSDEFDFVTSVKETVKEGVGRSAELTEDLMTKSRENIDSAIDKSKKVVSCAVEKTTEVVSDGFDKTGANAKRLAGKANQKMDDMSGKAMYEEVKRMIENQAVYNDVLATKLQEALERIEDLESRLEK